MLSADWSRVLLALRRSPNGEASLEETSTRRICACPRRGRVRSTRFGRQALESFRREPAGRTKFVAPACFACKPSLRLYYADALYPLSIVEHSQSDRLAYTTTASILLRAFTR